MRAKFGRGWFQDEKTCEAVSKCVSLAALASDKQMVLAAIPNKHKKEIDLANKAKSSEARADYVDASCCCCCCCCCCCRSPKKQAKIPLKLENRKKTAQAPRTEAVAKYAAAIRWFRKQVDAKDRSRSEQQAPVGRSGSRPEQPFKYERMCDMKGCHDTARHGILQKECKDESDEGSLFHLRFCQTHAVFGATIAQHYGIEFPWFPCCSLSKVCLPVLANPQICEHRSCKDLAIHNDRFCGKHFKEQKDLAKRLLKWRTASSRETKKTATTRQPGQASRAEAKQGSEVSAPDAKWENDSCPFTQNADDSKPPEELIEDLKEKFAGLYRAVDALLSHVKDKWPGSHTILVQARDDLTKMLEWNENESITVSDLCDSAKNLNARVVKLKSDAKEMQKGGGGKKELLLAVLEECEGCLKITKQIMDTVGQPRSLGEAVEKVCFRGITSLAEKLASMENAVQSAGKMQGGLQGGAAGDGLEKTRHPKAVAEEVAATTAIQSLASKFEDRVQEVERRIETDFEKNSTEMFEKAAKELANAADEKTAGIFGQYERWLSDTLGFRLGLLGAFDP